MIRVLLETNVVLDALLHRIPWNVEAEAIFEADLLGKVKAHMTATSLTDVFYLARKLTTRVRAWESVGVCLDQFKIIPVGRAALAAAVAGPGDDFEDNLQIVSASISQLDAIVTRDPKGFMGSPVAILSPAELLARCS